MTMVGLISFYNENQSTSKYGLSFRWSWTESYKISNWWIGTWISVLGTQNRKHKSTSQHTHNVLKPDEFEKILNPQWNQESRQVGKLKSSEGHGINNT